jgi:hypothetical protein
LELFLDSLAEKHASSGRLIFALDATASRQPAWDQACQLQADMFRAAIGVGGLEMQLVYYRGPNGECKASGWTTDSKRLALVMSRITCEGGYTQIEKVLRHTRHENEKSKIAALCFVGDAMEEKPDALCGAAGLLRDVPVFMFQEGDDAQVEKTFREIARLTRGAYAKFDPGAADQLRDLLKAVATFATGGIQALEGKTGATRLLLEQLK